MKGFRQFLEEGKKWWHGSASGDLRGGKSGLHLGTRYSAHIALSARIGHPVDGNWDGMREYGKTKLAGQQRIRDRGMSCTGHNCDAPEHDYYPHEHSRGLPKHGDGSRVNPSHKPEVKSYRITGKMSNMPHQPHSDTKSNALMAGSLKKGNARRGHYYKNDSEDEGSISAVVPNSKHIERD